MRSAKSRWAGEQPARGPSGWFALRSAAAKRWGASRGAEVMLGRGESEATGRAVSGLFLLMPVTHGPDFNCYFFPFFSPLPRFLFRAPWVVAGDEGEGRRGANPLWDSVAPSSERGVPSRSPMSPGALPAAGGRLRAAAAPPSGPTCAGFESPGRGGEAAGSAAGAPGAGRGVLGPAVVAGSVRLAPHGLRWASVRSSSHTQAPLSGAGRHLSSSAPHFAGPVVSSPSLA